MLMMLAFLVDQIQQLCCTLFRSVWKKLGSKKALRESIKSYFKCFLVKLMEAIFKALLYGIRTQPLEQLIDMCLNRRFQSQPGTKRIFRRHLWFIFAFWSIILHN
jgi:hypothetical protein